MFSAQFVCISGLRGACHGQLERGKWCGVELCWGWEWQGLLTNTPRIKLPPIITIEPEELRVLACCVVTN